MLKYHRSNWMGLITKENGEKNLSQFSIPGTHDSGTEKISAGFAHCQNFSIEQQLFDGIRFFDIRVKNNGKSLQLYHGSENCDINFDIVLNWCKAFLKEHTTETILMCVKGEESGQDISTNLKAYVDRNKTLFLDTKCLPTLNAARGKIVLFNRNSYSDIGIDWTGWRDNTNFCIHTKSDNFYIDDNYNMSFTPDKLKRVKATMDMAIKDPIYKDYFFVTFCSVAATFGHLFTPFQFAWSVEPAMNPNIHKYVKGCGYGKRLGVVLFDFYNKESILDNYLVDGIIQSNFNEELSPITESYKIEVKTGDKTGAGTDSNIILTMYGDKSSSYYRVKLNPLFSGNALEKNDLDSCTLKYNHYIGNIIKIRLRSDHLYAGADWYVSYVKITRNETSEVFLAKIDKWIEDTNDHDFPCVKQ